MNNSCRVNDYLFISRKFVNCPWCCYKIQ